MHKPRRTYLLMLLLSSFLLFSAFDLTLLDWCNRHGFGGGGGGAAPTAVPGSFTYSVSHRSAVQLAAATWSGRLAIDVNQTVPALAFSLVGTEQCGGTNIQRWNDSYSFVNWYTVNYVSQNIYDADPIHCGAAFVAHDLFWQYAWSFTPPGGGNLILGSVGDNCNLNDGTCGDFVGVP